MYFRCEDSMKQIDVRWVPLKSTQTLITESFLSPKCLWGEVNVLLFLCWDCMKASRCLHAVFPNEGRILMGLKLHLRFSFGASLGNLVTLTCCFKFQKGPITSLSGGAFVTQISGTVITHHLTPDILNGADLKWWVAPLEPSHPRAGAICHV